MATDIQQKNKETKANMFSLGKAVEMKKKEIHIRSSALSYVFCKNCFAGDKKCKLDEMKKKKTK